MADPHLIDKGGGDKPDLSVPKPDQMTPSYAMAVESAPEGSTLRKFADIIASQKAGRNVLEVRMKKIQNITLEAEPIKNLNFDDISEIIFEILNIKFEDCVGIDFTSGRYDTKEIALKANVDSSKYITQEPLVFKGHEISVRKMLNDTTKVTFKNVPMYVPDEEILHLCGIYGAVWCSFRK